MAITPKKAREEALLANADEVARHEALIDKFLVVNTPNSTGEHWYGGDRPSMTPTIRRLLIDIYDASGWNVNFISDEREGHTLVFKPKGWTK